MQILETHKKSLNSIYINLINKIKIYIHGNRLIRDLGYEIFENEGKKNQRDFNEIIENLIANPYLLIPYNLEDIVEGEFLI